MLFDSASSKANSARHDGATVPRVSVVMGTYNGERFLGPAIDSILKQTFSDFELIIVDDSSSDSTPQILSSVDDRRIRVIRNERNLGIAETLNRGLALAQGEYVALQDHDDCSMSARFEMQVKFLDSHADIALVGSGLQLIDEKGTANGELAPPVGDLELKWELLFRNPFHHTSFMIRRETLKTVGGYSSDPSFRFAEDYELTSRIAKHHGVANFSEPLVLWRRHCGAASERNLLQQQQAVSSISFRNIRALMGQATKIACGDLEYSCSGLTSFLYTTPGRQPIAPPDQIDCGVRLLCDLQKAFARVYGPATRTWAKRRRQMAHACLKHAIALAFRAPWSWRARLTIFVSGLRCLEWTAFAELGCRNTERLVEN